MKIKLKMEIFDPETGAPQSEEELAGFFDPETGDPIKTDSIDITKYVWLQSDLDEKGDSLHIEYCVGGYTTGGRFKANPFFPRLKYHFFEKLHTQDLWQKYNCSETPPSRDTVKNMLIEEIPAIHTLGALNWISRGQRGNRRLKAEKTETAIIE